MEYRGYNIVADETARMKKVEAIGRGSVHLSLRGLFTSEKMAKHAINIHENGKEEVNGKTGSTNRGKQV